MKKKEKVDELLRVNVPLIQREGGENKFTVNAKSIAIILSPPKPL